MVLAAAIVWWRPLLAGGAVLVVIAQLVFMFPELSAGQAAPAWTDHAPTLRLLDANVYDQNPSMTGYAGQITSVRPDLVGMEEATPTQVDRLTRDGALAGLPYRVQVKRSDPTAFLVASRYPLADANVVYLYGRPLIVQVTVHLPSGPLSRLLGVRIRTPQWRSPLILAAPWERRRSSTRSSARETNGRAARSCAGPSPAFSGPRPPPSAPIR